jgi:ribosomal-protein-alanine N-acetyltransferase
MPEIRTERLRLVALTLDQLKLYADAPHQLEQELGFRVSRDIVTPPLRRAIDMKVHKMERAAEPEHPWYTYWLIVIVEQPYGAGMAGFKGLPNTRGEVEIGYGIDPACRNEGYTTEAAKGLIDWAFRDPRCTSIVAPNTRKTNVASNRVLEKLGMHVYGETDDALHWRLDSVSVDPNFIHPGA